MAATEVIDVSHYNGVVDWRRVKAAGVRLAIAKATEGQHYQDETFAKNWREMKANGIQAGAYHYLRGGHPASSQVSNINTTLQRVDFAPDDMLVIDVEEGSNGDVSKDKMAETLHAVLEKLKGEYNNLWIYTGPSYWENKVAWRSHDFSGYKLWIAHYTTKSHPIVPTTWKTKGYSLWQYTDKGRVDGVQGNVDLSRF